MKKLYSPFALRAAFVVIFMLSFVRGWGQYSYSTIGSTYSQSFDGLGIANGSVTGGNLNIRSTTLNGWYIYKANATEGPTTAISPNTGSTNRGAVYNFGASGEPDRSLGGLQSGSFTPRFGFYFTNNTGVTVTSLKISYTGKTWRVGAASRSDKLEFRYSTNATSLGTGTWTAVTSLDYQNPGQVTGDGSVLHSASVTGTIAGLSVANGSRIFIRWDDYDTPSGADDGMAVDDFSLIANPVSTPTITVSPSSLNGLDYIFGAGPSPAKTFIASGTNLSADVIITPSANYEVSNGGTTWFSSASSPALSLSFGTGTLNNTSISVRLKAGLAVGNYNTTSDKITLTSTGATSKEIAVSGEVTAPPSPTIALGAFTATAMA